jgi:hypothetical protein
MAKQNTPPPLPLENTSARGAFANLNAKISELGVRRTTLTAQIVKIEKIGPSGVPLVFAIEAPDDSNDITGPAFELLNGAAIGPGYSKADDPSAMLYALKRQLAIVDRAIDLAHGQIVAASVHASREAAEEQMETSRALHRHRALLIVSLLKSNEQIEELRTRSAFGGSRADSSLDGFTLRLFGLPSQPSPMNTWPRRYLDACVSAGVVTAEEVKC